MRDDEIWDECEVCGEPLEVTDDVGEFVDDEGNHGICHAECGLQQGWDLA